VLRANLAHLEVSTEAASGQLAGSRSALLHRLEFGVEGKQSAQTLLKRDLMSKTEHLLS
jgi:hypothetical protein